MLNLSDEGAQYQRLYCSILPARGAQLERYIHAEGRNVSIRIMTQDSSDFNGDSSDFINECEDMVSLNKAMSQVKVSKYEGDLGNYCVITDAIVETVNSADTSVNNYVFTLFDQTDSVFVQNLAEELGNKSKENGIDISVITPSFEELVGFQKTICDVTGGIMIDTFGDFADDVYEHIFDETYEPKKLPPEPQKEFDAILITGYERITLDSILYPNGENPTGKDTDTDNDGLTDWDEVDVERWENAGLISRENNGYINLPTLKQCMDYTYKSYVEEGLGRFINQPTISLMLNDIRVMPISSDPTREDSDGDEVLDIYDKNPLIPIDNFSPCLNSDYGCELEGVEHHIMCPNLNEDCKNCICSNCGYTSIAPEFQDAELLNANDYVSVQMLLSIYGMFHRAGNAEMSEVIYSAIDKIRYYNSSASYSFSNSNGEYISPLIKSYITDENSLMIDIDICDCTNANKLIKTFEHLCTIGLYAVKDVGDIASIFVNPAWGAAWALASETILSIVENRVLNGKEVTISEILSVVDAEFETGGTFSAINAARSIVSHVGIYISHTVLLKSDLVRDTKDYCGQIIISDDTKQLSYTLNLNDIMASNGINIDYSDFNLYVSEYDKKLMPYRNTIQYSDSTTFGEHYSYLWAIVGEYYYWRDMRDVLDDNLEWRKEKEYPGGRYQ